MDRGYRAARRPQRRRRLNRRQVNEIATCVVFAVCVIAFLEQVRIYAWIFGL